MVPAAVLSSSLSIDNGETVLTTSAGRGTKAPKPRIREVPAVSRAIAILQLLGSSPDPMGVKAIATSLSLVPSTCLHILRVLVAERLVTVDGDTKRYALGSGMLSLARSVIERSGFATLAQPVLDRLSQTWALTSMGVEIQDSEHMIVLAISRAQTPFGLHVEVGSRFSTLVSATGRLFAAFGDQPWAQLRKRFAALRWGSPLDFTTWMKEVELARKRGFGVDRDRYINGVTVVAVPLLNGAGRITHALVGAGLSEQLDAPRITALAEDLRQEATRLATLILPKG
jgi:DNA-binding IclR family transcriptional regulator